MRLSPVGKKPYNCIVGAHGAGAGSGSGLHPPPPPGTFTDATTTAIIAAAIAKIVSVYYVKKNLDFVMQRVFNEANFRAIQISVLCYHENTKSCHRAIMA